MINLGRDICGNLEISSRLEWLETNGVGGYASGTVAGMHTRSYHALLVASTDAPLARVLLLSQLEEMVTYNGQRFALSSNQYPDAISPRGFLNLAEFRQEPFPTFVYRLADLLIEKRIFMTHGHNLTWVLYRLLTPTDADVLLSVRPQMNFRGLHLRKPERRFINTHHDLGEHVVRCIPNGTFPTLNLYHNAVAFEHSAMWYQNLFYREEDERGLASGEDLFSPGVLSFHLEPGKTVFVAATIANLENPEPESAADVEIGRRRALAAALPADDRFGHRLAMAADQFVVQRGEGLSIMAGYHWLSDCGRDAMIGLPGILLATGRLAEAKALLATYAGYCREGLLPNHFTEETNLPNYNTVDTALWFFQAVHAYRRAGGDKHFVRRKLWPLLEEIADYYIKGTTYRIRMDDDGLINLPEEAAQLTWMDAQVGDWMVTPRSGKPVEVNALWYNALCLLGDLAGECGERQAHERWAGLADKVREAFDRLFWNEKGGCLYDRVEDNFQDPTFRPNQLLALSLPHPLLTGERAKRTLTRVRRELGTTFGFRTLKASDPNYAGSYQGDIISREKASHQGTVWPWLIGPYADALLNVYGPTDEVKWEIHELVKPFYSHLEQYGLGTISEMFDGDPPHKARGCIARSGSVAEVLRLHLLLADLSRGQEKAESPEKQEITGRNAV